MQHDPTEHHPAELDILAVRILPDHDQQHIEVEHGFGKWDDTMLRDHDEQFIRPDGSIDLEGLHARDHRLSWDLNHEHAPDQQASREEAEQAFDRLNPEFGTPADSRDPAGQRATQEREAGLALGTRVAVAASRENDPNPVLAIAGQDYRAADAAREASRRSPSAAAWGAIPETEHDWGWER